MSRRVIFGKAISFIPISIYLVQPHAFWENAVFDPTKPYIKRLTEILSNGGGEGSLGSEFSGLKGLPSGD